MDTGLLVEHIVAVVIGIIVLITAVVALKNDWRSTGIENQVFKLMLGLLALGGLLGTLAGAGVIGRG